MVRTLLLTLIFVVAALFSYSCAAFIALSYDPHTWPIELRITYIAAVIFVLAMIFDALRPDSDDGEE